MSGEPDTFHSAYEDAQTAITKNYTDLISALDSGKPLSADQQQTIQSGVATTHKQLEQFACCTSLQAPFLISASGHWTQGSRLTTDYLKQLVSSYVYNPDQEVEKPFWQRMFGIRKLLDATPVPLVAQTQNMGRGRFWHSRQSVGPSHDTADLDNTAQPSPARKPALTRQNAFKLNEEQSQALTQQLGLTTHAHSGHDLLAAASAEAASSDDKDTNDGDSQAKAAGHESASPALGSSANLGSVIEGAKALSQGQVPKKTGAKVRALPSQSDPHQPFNASAAYANITRCNTRRWLALHAGGVSLLPCTRLSPHAVDLPVAKTRTFTRMHSGPYIPDPQK